ncbi:MAG TPA: DEAD/DEAH box helicase [Acidimicrobiia bacterium]|nr:DEAD/DEAH box helicase [Acidimicrobiia bacterium]
MTTFTDLGVPKELATSLAEDGFTSPFPIQSAVIPDSLAGRDICGRAPTGSGKTLAFGIPLMARLGEAKPRRPRALILAPTRELAEQIKQDLVPLAVAQRRWITAIYGGVGYEPQRRAMRKGVDVVVACPGRLADLIQEGAIDLSDVDMVVIDEADRMADMGFLPEVRKLLDMTSSKRQTWLFSATLDGDVAVLTRDYQNNPVRHEVGGEEETRSDARHLFWNVDHHDRLRHTADLIAAAGPSIIFCRTRHGADKVARKLAQSGIKAEAIHGGRSQGQRQRTLNGFTSGHIQAMVATDVAARGIHVEGVAAVVHFDPTDDPKTYLHRSGRTARAGSDGLVVSLVTADQRRQVGLIQRMVGLSHTFVDPAVDALGSIGERTSKPRMEDNRRSEETRRPRRKQSGHRQNRSRNRSRNRR